MNQHPPSGKLLAALGLSGMLCCAACQAGLSGVPSPVALPALTTPARTASARLASGRIRLPAPALDGETSVEEALAARRAVRDYSQQPLTLADCGQLLWAAQGITHPDGLRTAPSAGGLYPLEIFLVAGDVTGLPAGVYRYEPYSHDLSLVATGDRRDSLCEAAFGQQPLADGAAVIVIAGVYARTTGKYGDRGITYVQMEAGAAAQNLALQAVALNLGTVYMGAFDEEAVKQALALAADEEPLVLMPVGVP